MTNEEIAVQKQVSDFFKTAEKRAKQDRCVLCGKICSSFANSHSVPRFIIKRISVEGKLKTFNDIVGLHSRRNSVNNSWTFRIICSECENHNFSAYEDEDALLQVPTNKILAEIALKNALLMLHKYRVDCESEKESIRIGAFVGETDVLPIMNALNISDMNFEIRRSKKIIDKELKSGYKTLFYKVIDWVSPLAFQSAMCVYKNLDGSVLNQIYSEYNVHYNDYRASFMIAIYKQSHRILEKFVRPKIESSNFSRYDDSLKKIRRFYGIEDYITVFDATLDYAFAYAKYPSFLVPEIISLIIGAEEGKEENIDKANNWLIHYISVNAVDETKMHCAFEGFASCPIERKLQFVKAFIDNNSSYDMFEKMPLTPRSFGGTNSFISVYQGWIDYFKKMLPLFRGAKFIKHKNKVNGLIDQTNKMIEEEEVSNILQGF